MPPDHLFILVKWRASTVGLEIHVVHGSVEEEKRPIHSTRAVRRTTALKLKLPAASRAHSRRRDRGSQPNTTTGDNSLHTLFT